MPNDEPMSEQILTEAQGAHETSREILALMQEDEAAEDPIRVILGQLDAIWSTQVQMLARLEAIERQLGQRG